MSVLRSQRTYPLSLTADALNTGVVAAYDWAGDPASSWAGGNGASIVGGWAWTQGGTLPSVVTAIGGVTGMNGRDLSVGKTVGNNYYRRADLANLGLGLGTGAYSFWMRIRVPSAAPATTQPLTFARNRGSAGGELLQFGLYEVTSTAKYHPRVFVGASGTVVLEWSTSGNTGVAAGGVVDIHVTRAAGGTLKCFVNGVKLATGSDSSNWSTGGATATDNIRGIFTPNGNLQDIVLIDEVAWSRELSESEVTAHAGDPYSFWTNSAPASTITLTAPATGATIGTLPTLSGTYTTTTPTGIEYQWNGGAWTTLPGATIAGGNWSGSIASALAAGTGTLSVRMANATSVTASSTGVTVVSASITLAPPAIGSSADPYARANRIFQRNGSNQASVTIAGTYTGTVTSIEYQWAGGSWATLVASPSGGAFSQAVTLTGPGQGDLVVRFSNNTAVTSTFVAVGVGDVYLVGGQSNDVGMSPVFVPPVAPGAHPAWVAAEFSKANAWRANVETSGTPFDDRTGTAYPAVYTAATVYGSYFGRLATRSMANGVPVAFVPCAMGSTSISAWGSGSNLFTTMAARATIVGSFAGVIFWLGESDATAGTSQSTFAAGLDAAITAWAAAFPAGNKWWLANINNQGLGAADPSAVRAAIASVAATNANVQAVADMLGAWSTGDVHYNTSGVIDEVSLRMFNALYPGAVRKVVATLKKPDGTAITTGSWCAHVWEADNEAAVAGLAPAYSATGVTPDVSGNVTVLMPSTSRTAGQPAVMALSNGNGTVGDTAARSVFATVAIQ